MTKVAKKNEIEKDEELKRVHPKTIMLNARENKVFEKYCHKYKVKNQAKFMRETIISAILKKFEEDNPTLFDKIESNPNLFNNK